MSNNKTENVGGIDIDLEKVNRLTKWLIIKEKNNIRTKELNEGQMIKIIKTRIEEEAGCY